jgi:hypothetical protein
VNVRDFFYIFITRINVLILGDWLVEEKAGQRSCLFVIFCYEKSVPKTGVR